MLEKTISEKNPCPTDHDLELYLLRVHYDLPSRKIQSHVESCPICQDKLRQLQEFYRLLDQEMARPIPREAYLLAQGLEDV